MQQYIDIVTSYERSDETSAANAEAAYQAAISAVRAALREGKSTGDRVLDDAFALRRSHVIQFAEAMRALEFELAANVGKPVAVVYGDRAGVAVGAIASPRLIVDRLGQVMSVPTSRYERFDCIADRRVVHGGQIPLGSLATHFPPAALKERVRVAHRILSAQIGLVERAEEVRALGLVNVVRIGTSELDKRVPGHDFTDDSFLRTHKVSKREQLMVLGVEGMMLREHIKAWV